MKLSVSLSDDDVDFVDQYAEEHAVESRSAVLQRGIRMLRSADLSVAYAQAWEDWAESSDRDAWDTAVSDGIER